MKAMYLPSGDHAGSLSPKLSVSRRSRRPLALTGKMCWRATKVILLPSGDQSGCWPVPQ